MKMDDGKDEVSASDECRFCRRVSSSLKTCSKCKVAKYCDRECQRRDFKTHKVLCDVPEAQATDTMRKAETVRDTLGGYEMEITYNEETDLHQHHVECKKNPGHTRFTPVREFGMKHLPVEWQQQALLDSILAMARMTVRLVVKYVSKARPVGAFLYEERGQYCRHVASGVISHVFEKDVAKGDQPCVCVACTKSGAPKRKWYEIWVKTARHVVHDIVEARKTVIEYGYDDDNDRSGIIKMTPHNIIFSTNHLDDIALLMCAGHDECLKDVGVDLDRRHLFIKSVTTGPPLVVVVSHPHGCCKVVSLGCVTEEIEESAFGFYRGKLYQYDAATCPGCSGAPVWVLGSEDTAFNFFPHSKHVKGGINKSGPTYSVSTNNNTSTATNDSESRDRQTDDTDVTATLNFPPRFQNVLDAQINLNRVMNSMVDRLQQMKTLMETSPLTSELLAQRVSVSKQISQTEEDITEALKRAFHHQTTLTNAYNDDMVNLVKELGHPDGISIFDKQQNKLVQRYSAFLAERRKLEQFLVPLKMSYDSGAGNGIP